MLKLMSKFKINLKRPWKQPTLKSLYSLQIRLCNQISFGSFPFKLLATKNDNIHMETIPYLKLRFQCFLLAHLLTYLVKGMFLFKAFIIDGIAMDGNQMTRISFWFIAFSSGIYSYSFPLYKRDELTAVVNSLLNINFVKISQGVAFIVINSMFISTIVPIFYAVMLLYSNIDPITVYLEQYVEHIPTFYRILMGIFRVFDLWNFSYASRLSCFLIYETMVASYLSTVLLLNKIRAAQSSLIPFLEFKRSILEYRQTLVYTEMVNRCFKNSVALPFKISISIFGILLGTVALDNKLRTSSNMDAFCLSVYTLVNVNLLLILAYSIPGNANTVSKRIMVGWKNLLATRVNNYGYSRKTLREIRRLIKSTNDVRLYYGELNYYKNNTGVIILNFMMESTLNLVLMK